MKRLLPFVILIILVIGGIVSIPFLLRPEVQKARIADTLTKVFRHPVIVGDLSIGYLPPSLQISKIAVTNTQNEPILQVDKVTAPLNLAALVRMKVAVDQIELAGWKATITRKVDGRWNAGEWWPGQSGFSDAKSWPLNRVHWQQGEIRWVDPFSATSQEVVLSLVEGSWNPRPETLEAHGSFSAPFTGADLSIAAKGQFFNQPRWTGELEMTEQGNSVLCQLSYGADGFTMKGQSSKWRLSSAAALTQFLTRLPRASQNAAAALTIDNWQFQSREAAGKVEFSQTATISGGQAEAKGTLTPTPRGVALHLEAAASAVPAEALLTLTATDMPLSGKLTGITKNLEVILSSQTSSTVSGFGYTEITSGQYKFPETSIQKLSKAKTTRYIKTKYPDLASTGVPFDKMSAHWTAKDGKITVDDGFLTSSSGKAGWTGSLDIARQGLDGFLRIDFKEKDAKLKALLPTKYLSQPAYGRLQGHLQEWYLRAMPSTKIPPAVQSKLRKAVVQK